MCTFAKMTPVACLPRRWWVSSWRRWIRSVFSQGGDIERCFSISIIRTWTSDFFILICLVTVSYWTQQLNQEKNHTRNKRTWDIKILSASQSCHWNQGILTKEDFQWGVLNLLGQLEDPADSAECLCRNLTLDDPGWSWHVDISTHITFLSLSIWWIQEICVEVWNVRLLRH